MALKPVTVSSKSCTRCNLVKHWEEFGRNNRMRSGLGSWCKACKSQAQIERTARKKQNAPKGRFAHFANDAEREAQRRSMRFDLPRIASSHAHKNGEGAQLLQRCKKCSRVKPQSEFPGVYRLYGMPAACKACLTIEADGGNRCARCEETKPRTEFHKSARSKSGLQSYCKTCSAHDGKERWGKRQAKKGQAKPSFVIKPPHGIPPAVSERSLEDIAVILERHAREMRSIFADMRQSLVVLHDEWRMEREAQEGLRHFTPTPTQDQPRRGAIRALTAVARLLRGG